MAVSFLHVFLKPKEGVTSDQVKEKMDLALDWYKYADDCWVVKTTSEIEKWQARLKPLAEPDGSLLIFKLDASKRQGWLAKSFWKWLRDAGSDE
ncbi:hypothetical protein [Stenotrophomonas sepilia]|uniref:hypothetical protein n=1 Tax=Stenotrophomonas sepilia TaxID=2860290 RepID=UPI002E79D21A|nr:hypothetical protein [Stenotrophomonas sepilia]